MNPKPRIQLKPSKYTMASLMASSKLGYLEEEMERSRFTTLGLSKVSINQGGWNQET